MRLILYQYRKYYIKLLVSNTIYEEKQIKLFLKRNYTHIQTPLEVTGMLIICLLNDLSLQQGFFFFTSVITVIISRHLYSIAWQYSHIVTKYLARVVLLGVFLHYYSCMFATMVTGWAILNPLG